MNIKQKADLLFGDKLEQSCIIRFNDYFKCTLNKISTHSIIDFIDDESKIIIELKGRRCRKHQYVDTMIGVNKLYEAKKYIDKGYSCYFAFSFCDKLCYYEYDGNINNKWIRNGGRYDRGCTETNSYYHIPCTLLKDIK